MSDQTQLDVALKSRSAAYLAMWKALACFDPQEDRWSDPAPSLQSAQKADEAFRFIAQAQARINGSSADEFGRDVQAFNEALSLLRQGAGISPSDRRLFRAYRDLGIKLAHASVHSHLTRNAGRAAHRGAGD